MTRSFEPPESHCRIFSLKRARSAQFNILIDANWQIQGVNNVLADTVAQRRLLGKESGGDSRKTKNSWVHSEWILFLWQQAIFSHIKSNFSNNHTGPSDKLSILMDTQHLISNTLEHRQKHTKWRSEASTFKGEARSGTLQSGARSGRSSKWHWKICTRKCFDKCKLKDCCTGLYVCPSNLSWLKTVATQPKHKLIAWCLHDIDDMQSLFTNTVSNDWKFRYGKMKYSDIYPLCLISLSLQVQWLNYIQIRKTLRTISNTAGMYRFSTSLQHSKFLLVMVTSLYFSPF